jgi:hypothetical protein
MMNESTGGREDLSLDDLRGAIAIALACAYPNIQLAADAKRNIGSLWRDINKAPYTLIFNRHLSAYRAWHCVEVLRAVDSRLNQEVMKRDGEERRIAIHGNRFILHWIFRILAIEEFDKPDLNISSVKQRSQEEVPGLIDEIATVIETRYPYSYLNTLFKSGAQCNALATHLRIPQVIDLNIPYYAAELSSTEQASLFEPHHGSEDH